MTLLLPPVMNSAPNINRNDANTNLTIGREVVNRDLIEQAADLQDELEEEGSVQYIWVPRSENEEADAAVNDALDWLDASSY